MLNFKDFLTEKWNLGYKTWVDYDMSKMTKEEAEVIWEMYITTYQAEGLDLSADDSKELIRKYKATWLMDINNDKIPDAFIIHKETKYGNKIALLGSNGVQQAKRELIRYVLELLKLKGWYIEASAKMEEILRNSSIPHITDENIIIDIVGSNKEPEMMDDGYYKRYLSKAHKKIIKRIYGTIK